MIVESNMRVVVRYQLRTSEGEVIDAGEEPIAYVHGYGMLVPGLEVALAGMKAGEKKTVALEPEDAFGEVDHDLVFTVDGSELPEGASVGDELECESPDGESVEVRLIAFTTGGDAILDANHPLAGVSVVYDVEITDIRTATTEEIREAAAEEEARDELVQLQRKSLKDQGDGRRGA